MRCQFKKTSIRVKSKMNWLKDRVKEMSSWSGASLIVLGTLSSY